MITSISHDDTVIAVAQNRPELHRAFTAMLMTEVEQNTFPTRGTSDSEALGYVTVEWFMLCLT